MSEEIEMESLQRDEQHKNKNIIKKTLEQNKNHIKAFDFFTQYDVKTNKRTNTNKVINNKTNSDYNLMELINCELATTEISVASNVIKTADYPIQANYMLKELKPDIFSIFQERRINKFQHSLAQKNVSSNLYPDFPQVVENSLNKDDFLPVEYVRPILMDNWQRKFNLKKTVTTRFLDITILNLNFKCHQNFSLEHLLANKLIDTFNTYKNLKQAMENILKEIKINRETKKNLHKELQNVIPKKEKLKFDPTIRKYTKQMLDLKHDYNDKLKEEKCLLNNIISLWSDVELVRHKSNKVNTPYKLNVIENNLNEKDFKILWDETFETEFSDLLDEIEYDFVSNYLQYKEEKQNLKNSNMQKKMSKPQFLIDENELKLETENIVKSFFQKDKIRIELLKDENIVTRQKKPVTHTINLRIYVDDIYVCETENHSFTNFSKVLNESFFVQVVPNNIALIIALHVNDQMSLVTFNISDLKNNSDITETQFDFHNIIPPTSKYIGSGFTIKDIASVNKVRLKSSSLFDGIIKTQCLAYLKIHWNNTIKESDAINIKSLIEVEKKLKRMTSKRDKPNFEEIISIMEHIYEKQITNENILESIANICKTSNSIENFEFDMTKSSLDLVRLKLLHLRSKGEMSNVDNQTVPLHGSQISTEQLEFLQKRELNELSVENLTSEKYSSMDPIELQRYIGFKYIESLNKNILRTLHDFLFKKSFQDVVFDYQDLDWRNFFTKQLNIARIPNISNNKMSFVHDVRAKEIHITVIKAYNLPERMATIIKDDELDDADDNVAGFRMRSLRPFVRVQHKNNIQQTATTIGCHPTWNQTLTFSNPPDSQSSIEINIFDEEKCNIAENYPDSDSYQSRTTHYRYLNKWIGSIQIPIQGIQYLGKISGTYKINVPPIMFGYECLSNGKESNQSLLPDVSRMLKKEASFLSLKITYKHSNPKNNLHLPSSDEDYILNHLNTFLVEYNNDFPSRQINLTGIDSNGKRRCVTQFLQPVPPPANEYFPRSFKIGSAMSKSSNPSKASSSFSDEKSPDKDVEKLETEDSIYSTYGTKNSKDVNRLEKMIFGCMRFVSLIPTYEFLESYSVTLTGMELLKVLCGTPYDHTILLGSYFIYLGIKTYIAIGTGFPQGRSSYVLTKYDLRNHRTVLFDDQNTGKKTFMSKNDGVMWYVYDANCGERYELRDITCPLRTVDYIFDDENIWVNIQSTLDCESISFDLNKTSDWQTVFSKSIFVAKLPAINDVGFYTHPPVVEQLREVLENKIKLKIQKWRPHMKTIWNRYCSALLKEMLPQLEYWLFFPTDTKPGYGQKLKQLMITYKVHGFPLHMPYTRTKSIISKLKSTAIYLNEDPNVEFALAVELYSYPNNVLSVWIFLASMSRI